MLQSMPVFLRDEVQELIDAFAHCFRVKITLFSATMEELRVGLKNPGADFCHLVQEPLHLLGQCRAMDRDMCNRARAINGMTRYRCHAGLIEAILPIRVEGVSLGFLMLGQFRDSLEPLPVIQARWNSLNGSDESLRAAFFRLPYFDALTLEKMMTLFSMLVQFIVSQQFVAIERGNLMNRVTQYVIEHLAEPIMVDELAAALDKSTSTIAHTVKEKTGLSLGQFIARRRIEQFELLLRGRPETTIQEGALAVGFGDPLYFSRVYRRLRGTAPSTFIAELRRRTQSV